jgi:plastocyanin
MMLCLTFGSSRTSVFAGEIRGTIGGGSGTTKAPARYVVRGQSKPTSSSSFSGAVAVAIEPLDTKVTPTLPDTPFVMAQENTSFVPNLLVVPVGSQVTFPNHDAFFHNVFSYSPPRSFDLGRYPKGESRTVTFDEPGIVRIFCEIHASMYGSILVVPSDHYQIINAGDGFSFPNLPDGQYRVIAVDAAGRRAKSEIELNGNSVSTVSLMLE